MHAAASVFLGFMRPYIIKLAPRDGYDSDAVISLKQMGILWMVYYLFISIFLHHLFCSIQKYFDLTISDNIPQSMFIYHCLCCNYFYHFVVIRQNKSATLKF